MKTLAVGLAFAAALLPAAYPANATESGTPLALVLVEPSPVITGSGSPAFGPRNAVVPVDLGDDVAEAPIYLPPGWQPSAIAAAPDSSNAYVAIASPSSMVVPIDLANSTVQTPISLGTTSNEPVSIAVSRDGLHAYAAVAGINQLVAIDLQTDAVAWSRQLTHLPETSSEVTSVFQSQGEGADTIALTSDGRFAYVVESESGAVIKVNLANQAMSAPIRLSPGKGPIAIAVTPNRRWSYVANWASGSLTRLRLSPPGANSSRATQISLPRRSTGGELRALALSPNGSNAYLALFSSNEILAVSIPTDRVKELVKLPSSGNGLTSIVVTPDDKSVLGVELGGNSLLVASTSRPATLRSIDLGQGIFASPGQIAVTNGP